MACGQCHELLAPAGKERISTDDERSGVQLVDGYESGAISPSLPAFKRVCYGFSIAVGVVVEL
jgi:hypothetical protein